MKLFLLLNFIFLINISAQANVHEQFVTNQQLKLTKADHIIGEHMVNMMKLIEQGYVNKDTLGKVLNEAEKSAHFKVFVPWLSAVKEISKLSKAQELVTYCRQYQERKEKLSLEKVLERIAGNYCR